MALQKRPSELIAILEQEFRRSYDPGAAFGQAIGLNLSLPGLRGYWPFSSVSELGNVFDLSGQGRTVTDNGGVLTAAAADKLVAYGDFNSGSSQYYSRADEAGLDITGALTLGGWFYFTTVPASSMGLISKNVPAGNQRAYTLFRHSSNFVRFQISDDGISAEASDSAATLDAGVWYFIAGRFRPSNDITVWVDDVAVETNTELAAIFNSTAAFEIGRTDSGNYLNGRAAHVFICAYALSDDTIFVLRERTRPLFGK